MDNSPEDLPYGRDKALSQLFQDFQEVQNRGFGELWYTKESGEMLGIVVSREHALMLYLQEEGDTGLHSSNPAYSGQQNEMVEFVLANGQRDTYPLIYTVSLEEAQRVGEYFLSTGELAPWVMWLPSVLRASRGNIHG